MVELLPLLDARFHSARESGNLNYTETSSEIIKVNNLQFQLRTAPSVGLKPVNKLDNDEKNIKKDPFGPPDKNLLVCTADDLKITDNDKKLKYSIVLNKFPIIPIHFLLITDEFVSQNSPLTPYELKLMLEILQIIDGGPSGIKLSEKKETLERFMAFFNCGEASGASQPHRHIQFIPIPSKSELKLYPDLAIANYQTSEKSEKINPKTGVYNLNSRPIVSELIPFEHYILPIDDSTLKLSEEKKKNEETKDENENENENEDGVADILGMRYSQLLSRTLTVLRNHNNKNNNNKGDISYNFVMTSEWMLMVPRKQSDYLYQDNEKNSAKIGINSSGIAGLIYAKSKNDTDHIKQVGPLAVLEQVCFTKEKGEEHLEDEYFY